MAGGFQFGAFQFNAFQQNVSNAVGKIKNKAKELTKQKLKADLLAEKYNKAKELNNTETEIQTAVVVKPFKFGSDEPIVNKIDFEALARDRKATQELLAIIARIEKMAAQEEEEIFNFMMALA